jgi:hypothetical protein
MVMISIKLLITVDISNTHDLEHNQSSAKTEVGANTHSLKKVRICGNADESNVSGKTHKKNICQSHSMNII